MALLTDKEQPFVGTIGPTGMPTHRTCLRGVMSIDFDGHTPLSYRFVGNHRVQFGESPLGLPSVCFALLLASLLATSPPGALADTGQVLQSNQAMGMSLHKALTHDMIGVLRSPSLPSTDDHESPPRRTGAFALKTFSQSCVVLRFGNNLFPSVEGTITLRGTGYGQVANAGIHTDHAGLRLWRWVSHLDFQGHKQVELLLRLVIPQLGGSDLGSMLVVARIGEDEPTLQGQDAHPLVRLEAVVMPQLIRQGGRDVLWRLVKSLVAFLCFPCLTLGCILLDLRPESFVGRPAPCGG